MEIFVLQKNLMPAQEFFVNFFWFEKKNKKKLKQKIKTITLILNQFYLVL